MKQESYSARRLGRELTLALASVTRTGIILAGTVMVATAAHAQYRASLRGTVTDPSGAAISGATVTLIDTGTNQTMTATTSDSGLYTFNALPPDHFRLTAEKQGFKKKQVAEVVPIPEQPNELNVQMELGDTAQEVIVSGSAAPLLDTDTATVSATISSNQVQHLPSYNRDVFQLAQLAPGVFGDGAQSSGGGTSNNPGNQGPGGSDSTHSGIFQTENGPQVQARGGQYETNGISIDGISTVSAVWGGTSIITPSEDSVDNVKVVSNSYDAEVGRFSGGQIQITSKSGTNQVHGSLFFKASRPGLNAYQRWNGTQSNRSGTAAQRGVNRDNTRLNNYGGSLGAPIWKDRVFAFFNYETSPLSSSTTGQGWYETPQFLANVAGGTIASQYATYQGEGVASSAVLARTCASIGLTEGVNCNTLSGGLDVGSPLKNGVGNLDPSYQSSSVPGVGGGLDGVPDLAFFNTVNPQTVSAQQYNGRLDANVTANDHLSFAIYWVPYSSTSFNGPVRSANFWHHQQINDAFAVIWNHTFSPTLINQARANAAGWRWNEASTNPQAPFGLPSANIDNIGTIGNDNGFQYFGAPGPSNLNQWTYDYSDVLTKILGRHSVKVGGSLTRLYYLNNPIYATRPSFNFRNEWDFANDAPYGESGQFNPKTGVPFPNRQDDRVNIWGFFVQDDWKIRPNLTINAGLRWSYFGAFYSKQNNLGVVQNINNLQNLSVRVGGSLYTPQKTNFGPQLGFAWQPTESQGKLVIRGGFGINFNQNEIAITANGNGNPPTQLQANFCCSTANAKNPSILYETATDIHSLFGYAPNPAAIATYNANNLPAGAITQVTGYEPNPKTIANYHYSLDMQYQFPLSLVASVGYQGSQNRHLLVQSNYNVIAAGRGIALNPAVNSLDYYANSGSSNYNAMIATLTHSFSHHFQAEAQYAWAKSMDMNSGPYEEDPYPYNPRAAYGRSDYNVGNGFKLFGLWQPIIFSGSHGWLEKVAGGWSVSGIFNVHGGFPLNPTYGTNTGGSNLFYNGSGYNTLRPTAILGNPGTKTSNDVFRGIKTAYNPNYGPNPTTSFGTPGFTPGPAFPATAPAPQPGIQRNQLTGPGYNDLDGTLTKAFGLPKMPLLGENAKFEVRADAYNLFNKINIDSTSINTTVGTANADGTNTPNSGFGIASRALGSRTVQLQARFSF